MTDKNSHIPTEEIEQDIKDTQNEIDDYQDEKDILMRNPQDNRARIYLLEGKISKREDFINNLNKLLEQRNK